MAKNKGGRPTKFTKETLQKLEQAFAIGASDNEACLYANISPSTLYSYQERNPEFLERKHMLKDKPLLKARQTVVNNLDDAKHAEWYLERKNRNEFATRTEQDHSGEIKHKPVYDLGKLSDDELEQLEKLTDKTRNTEGED